MKKKLSSLLMIVLSLCVCTVSFAGAAQADPDHTPLPEAGTYLLIAETSKTAAVSMPSEYASQMAQDALAANIESGLFLGLVLREDGTGNVYRDIHSYPFALRDGYLFTTTHGESYVSYGNIIASGVKDGGRSWVVYYRITPEQAASLPEPSQQESPSKTISDIRVDSDAQMTAYMQVIYPLYEADADVYEAHDKAYYTVQKVAAEEALSRLNAEEEQKSWSGMAKESFEFFSERQLTLATLMELNGGSVPMFINEGNLTFFGGTCTDKPVKDEKDAYDVLMSMVSLLGGTRYIEYEYLRTLRDDRGYSYYVFLQMHDLDIVDPGVAKIIVNQEQEMVGLTSTMITNEVYSLSPSQKKAVDPESLAGIVQNQDLFPGEELTFYPDRTEKILRLCSHSESDENWKKFIRDRFVWVVYSNNPSYTSDPADPSKGEEYPYLAHYIGLDGEYLYNLPVFEPGDLAASSGFSTSYLFREMEPCEWTGTVTYKDGHEETITVPVMKNPKDGMYYMGDRERMIVLADYYEYNFNNNHMVMESSGTNADWDNYHLILYKNILDIWDYFAEAGWKGMDGKGSPALILTGYGDQDHQPYYNAAHLGALTGWNVLAFSEDDFTGMTRDETAHEFMHGVSSSTIYSVHYRNEYGAISESLSDIMGNLFEFQADPDKDDPLWLLGETIFDNGERSMGDPHLHNQPEYIWDLTYIPTAANPDDSNDAGGVHTNSSLLNRIAYRLCAEASMSLKDAQRFWTYVANTIVPLTDFEQISAVLPWIMEDMGLGEYTDELKQYIADARIADKSLPEKFEPGTSLVVLQLPDKDEFKNEKWILYVNDVDLTYHPAYPSLEGKTESDEKELLKLAPTMDVSGYIGEDEKTIRIMVKNDLPKMIYLVHYAKSEEEENVYYKYNHGEWFGWYETSVIYYTLPDGIYPLSNKGL